MPSMISAPTGGSDVNVGSDSLTQQSLPCDGTPDLLYASLRLPPRSQSIRVLDLDPLPRLRVNRENVPLSGKLRIVQWVDKSLRALAILPQNSTS
jgi:hypothetical protein